MSLQKTSTQDSTDSDDNYHRLYDGGSQEVSKGSLITIEKQRQETTVSTNQKIQLNNQEMFEIAQGKTKNLEKILKKNEQKKFYKNLIFPEQNLCDAHLAAQMYSELGFFNKTPESSIIKINHKLVDKPSINFIYHGNKQLLLANYTETFHQAHSDHDVCGSIFIKYLSLFDLNQIEDKHSDKDDQVKLSSQFISQSTSPKFANQKMHYQVEDKIYYFKFEYKDDDQSFHTEKIMLMVYDLNKSLLTSLQDVSYHCDDDDQSVLCAMFVNQNNEPKDEREFKEMYVAFIHRREGEKEKYYATIRQIEHLNDIIHEINLGDHVSAASLDYQLIFNVYKIKTDIEKENSFLLPKENRKQEEFVFTLTDLRPEFMSDMMIFSKRKPKRKDDKKNKQPEYFEIDIPSHIFLDQENQIKQDKSPDNDEYLSPQMKYKFINNVMIDDDIKKQIVQQIKDSHNKRNNTFLLFEKKDTKEGEDNQNEFQDQDKRGITEEKDKEEQVKKENPDDDGAQNQKNKENQINQISYEPKGYTLNSMNTYDAKNFPYEDLKLNERAYQMNLSFHQSHYHHSDHNNLGNLMAINNGPVDDDDIRHILILREQNSIFINFYKQFSEFETIKGTLHDVKKEDESVGNQKGQDWIQQKHQELRKHNLRGINVQDKIQPNLILFNKLRCEQNLNNPIENVDYIELRARSLQTDSMPVDFVFSQHTKNLEFSNEQECQIVIIIYESDIHHTLMHYRLFFETINGDTQFTRKPEFLGDTIVLINSSQDSNFSSQNYESDPGQNVNGDEIIGVKYGKQSYFQIPNPDIQLSNNEKFEEFKLLNNEIFKSDLKLFEFKHHEKEKTAKGLISSNYYKTEMLEKLRGDDQGFFDMQDRFQLSLMHHETKLNLVPCPDQDIQKWINSKETNLSILQPLKILDGQTIANLLIHIPQRVKEIIDKKGTNAQQSYLQQVFNDENNNLSTDPDLEDKLKISHAGSHIRVQKKSDSVFNLSMETILDVCYSDIKDKDNSVVEQILVYIQNNQSSLNEKVIGCIVPQLIENGIMNKGLISLFNDDNKDNLRNIKYLKKLEFKDEDQNNQIPAFYPEKNIILYDENEVQQSKFKNGQFQNQNYLQDKQKVLKTTHDYINTFPHLKAQKCKANIFWQDLSLYNIKNIIRKDFKPIDKYKFLQLMFKFATMYPNEIQNCTKLRSLIDCYFFTGTSLYCTIKGLIWFLLLFVPFNLQLVFNFGKANYWLLTSAFIISVIQFINEVSYIKMKGLKYFARFIWSFMQFFSMCWIFVIKTQQVRSNYGLSPILFDQLKYEETHSGVTKDPLCSTLDPQYCKIGFLDKYMMILNSFVTITLMNRVLQFMRQNQETRNLSILIYQTILRLIPLVFFFILWVVFFAIQSITLGAGIEQALGFTGLSLFMGYIFASFENGIGPVVPPTLHYWEYHNKYLAEQVIVYLIWIYWLLQQIFLLIIVLNFVIAKVNDIYTDVTLDQVRNNYYVQMELNDEYYSIAEFWKQLSKYFGRKVENQPINLVICISPDADDSDQWNGIIENCKQSIKSANNDVMKKIDDQSKQLIEVDQSLNALFKLVDDMEKKNHKESSSK